MNLAILSARVFTNNPLQPWAEAIGIRNGRILNVGRNEDVRHGCPAGTRMMKLPGRLIIPGIIDGHCHFVKFGLMLRQIDLRGLSSLGSCRERIRHAVRLSKPGEWIIGRGWDQHRWEEKREPTRHDLDDLTPFNPTVMIRVCGHSLWVNTPALTRSGIDAHTRDPAGGRIERDPGSGEPSGLIREALDLIEDHIPPLDMEDRKRAALAAQDEALRFGITGVHSCETSREWSALAELVKEGALKLRVYHLIASDELEDAVSTQRGGIDGNRLWSGHVKLFADGSLGSATALLHEPYIGAPTEYGIPCLSPEDLHTQVKAAYRHGYDVAIHAIGDKAVTNALEAVARARKCYPGSGRRDRIEHVQLFRPGDLALFRDLNVTASVQPIFLCTDRGVALEKWGTARCRSAYAWKSLLNAGIPLQFGSDAPVEPIDPLLGFQWACTRRDAAGEEGEGWFPTEKLTVDECIRAFTLQPAWTSRKEDHLGILAHGRWADLTIFNRDILTLSPEHWASVEVEMTVVDGEIVYHR